MKNSSLFQNFTLNTSHSSAPRYIDTLQHIAPEILLIDRVISPIWYVIGFIGNPLSAIVWFGHNYQKNSSAIYQGVLSIVNIYFLTVHLIMELNYAWGVGLYDKPGACEVFNVFLMIPQYLSPMLVLAFTVERYIAVCHPFHKRKFCTVRRAWLVSLLMFVISACLSSVQGYIWDYDENIKQCAFLSSGDHKFEKIWTLITESIHFLLIPLCVLVFNILVIIEIRKITARDTTRRFSGNNSNQTSTVTLLSVSFFFICTLLPASIVYAMQSLLPHGKKMSLSKMMVDPTWTKYFKYLVIRKAVEEVCLSNQACYFFIYYVTGRLFRMSVRQLLCRFCCKCCKPIEKLDDSKEYSMAMYSPVCSNDQNVNSQEVTSLST